MFESLKTHHRWLMEANLKPIQGTRFQPTGFADLGAARYLAPDGETWMLLVESAQSVANRLEATIIAPGGDLVSELDGLSYIRVQLEGASDAKTNSMVEAHRINSPFIISDKDFQQRFVEMSGYSKNRPLHWPDIARTLFRFDVNSLLHGCFLANLEDGRVRTPRALTGFIEAAGVREAVSGGVKNNPIDPTGTLRAVAEQKDVYGNVPYQRVEYTAERITAYFNLDLGLLRSFDLPDPAFELLVALGLLKIRRFLDHGMRLRTACDLQLDGPLRVTAPEGAELPDEARLLAATKDAIHGCAELLGDPPVTELTTKTKIKGKQDQE